VVTTADARVRARVGESPNDRRAEVAGSARDRDDPSVERRPHDATLATVSGAK
jgi:hypothetical protein